METSTLLVFMRGDATSRPPEAELEQMQKGHIANLQRLYDEKKAAAAGPFLDGKDERGIVILTLPREKVEAEFANDPFVKAGLLKLRLYRWMHAKSIFAWPRAEGLEMTDYLFGIAKKGDKWSADGLNDSGKSQTEHVRRNFQMMSDGVAAIVGPLTDSTDDWRGIYIFHGKDKVPVEKLLATDPLVVKNQLKVELKPLMMAKGLFLKYKP